MNLQLQSFKGLKFFGQSQASYYHIMDIHEEEWKNLLMYHHPLFLHSKNSSNMIFNTELNYSAEHRKKKRHTDGRSHF